MDKENVSRDALPEYLRDIPEIQPLPKTKKVPRLKNKVTLPVFESERQKANGEKEIHI